MYKIEITSTAKKGLKKLSKKKQRRFFEIIKFLEEFPFSGKKLSGKLSGYYSIRLWPYRVVYVVGRKKKKITVVAIKPRQDVYR